MAEIRTSRNIPDRMNYRASFESLRANTELWDHFTRKEEYEPDFRDQYDRFSFYLSRYRDIFEPDVSEYLLQKGLEPVYPENKRFAVCLTHDIDVVVPPITNTLYFSAKLLISGQKKNGLKVLLSRLSKKINPFHNFRQIMDIEKKYDARSSFYFLVQEKGEMDYRYDVADLRDELRSIAENGWEVGLHGSHTSYNDLKDVLQRKKKLESILGGNVVGYRNHYLRFRVPDTWNILHQAGFEYDTTLGYSECIGFRNGMCHPFRPFDLNANEEIGILEIPLTVMDGTVFGSFINPNSMNLEPEAAWDLVRHMIDRVAECRGVITVLWHNTSMLGDGLEFYEMILEYCREKGAWMTSGKDLNDWMRTCTGDVFSDSRA